MILTLLTNPGISYEWGNGRIVNTTYSVHLCHRYAVAVNQVMVATLRLSKWWRQPPIKEIIICEVFCRLLFVVCLSSFRHCIVCRSSIYFFWLPLWYLVVIVLSVVLLSTASYYHFGILWSLYCVSFYLRLLNHFGILWSLIYN